jgi:electron transfer flavoprotein alpha subunit
VTATVPTSHAAAAAPPFPTLTGTVAVVVARAGVVPPGGAEAIAEAGGQVLVVGSGAREAAAALHHTAGGPGGTVRWADTGPGLRVGDLAARLAGLLTDADLVVLPGSADGRDLAPRLAAALDAPLLAGAVSVTSPPTGDVRATLARLGEKLLVTVECAAPAVATLRVGSRSVHGPGRPVPAQPGGEPIEVALPPGRGDILDVEVVEILEPDPATMDLAEARRVLGGGAGLVARSGGLAGVPPTEAFALLGRVAAALGASAGATRVVTDAGWLGYDRQIGTTGITLDPELYIAFGVSGASQHTGGLGAPSHVVSVNTDPSSPMTAMADLGLVTDAGALLVELARRLGVELPPSLDTAATAGGVPDPRAER